MKNLLKQFGIEDIQTSIYINILKGHSRTISEISRYLGISRTTLYPYMEELLKKGLLKEIYIGKTRSFLAVDPEIVVKQIIRSEKKQQDSKDKKLKEFIKSVKNIKKSNLKKRSSIEVIYTKSLVVSILEELLKEKSDIYWYGSFNYIIDIVGEKELYDFFTLPRMKTKTTAYAVTDGSINKYQKFVEMIGNFRRILIQDKPIKLNALIVTTGSQIVFISGIGRDFSIKRMVDQDLSLLYQGQIESLFA